MKRPHSLILSLTAFAVVSLIVNGITASIFAQPVTVGNVRIAGIPEDWTHHHLVFSDPGTEAAAIRNGTYLEWTRITSDPRYILQQLKRGLPVEGPAAGDVARMEQQAQAMAAAATTTWLSAQKPKVTIGKDWSMVLGPSAKVGAGMYPAKFSFNPIGTPNCGSVSSPDFVVYNTSAAGSSTQASIVAYDNLYSGCSGQVPSVYWAFNTGGTVQTSVVLSATGSQLAFIQTPSSGNAQLVLLTWKATPTGRSVTGSVTSSSKNFTVSGTLTSMDVGAGISGTGIPSGDTIATVTSSTAGTLTTAASATHSGESLAITADAGGPDTLTAVSNSSYPGCAAPCMTTLTFSGTSRSDTISSPFYDYHGDALYVGDASGGLHKFSPVFNGTPAEVKTSGGPWAAVSSTALSSPVYDPTTQNVFVGDASGYLYSVNSSGAVTKSVQVAVGPGIVDSPLVDSAAGQLYAFVSQDLNANVSNSACGNSGNSGQVCNGVIQLPTNFGSSTQFTESVMGQGTSNTLYAGAFDNNYWTHSGTGNIYAIGAKGSSGPKLSEIPVTSGGFSTAKCPNSTNGSPANCSALQCATNIVNPMTSAAATGSPVTEILNGSTDYIFTSVSASGNLSGCSGACVYSWTVTTALNANATPTAGLVAAGGTSGMIIDNTSATTGASQVYFSTLGTTGTCTTSGTLTTGGCAVQASQSALQ